MILEEDIVLRPTNRSFPTHWAKDLLAHPESWDIIRLDSFWWNPQRTCPAHCRCTLPSASAQACVLTHNRTTVSTDPSWYKTQFLSGAAGICDLRSSAGYIVNERSFAHMVGLALGWNSCIDLGLLNTLPVQRFVIPALFSQSNHPVALRAMETFVRSCVSRAQASGQIKVLLYVTTAWSDAHTHFLRACWPSAVRQQSLYNMSDLMFVVTNNHTLGDSRVEAVLSSVLQRNITVRKLANPGFQSGAILPVTDALRHGVWDGYDWVIRINPDVLFTDEQPLLAAMRNDNIDGIFVNCNYHKVKLHTDFFAVRPRALTGPPDLARATPFQSNAEEHATAVFDPILKSGRFVWLPGAQPIRNTWCRVDGTTVVHLNEQTSCERNMTQVRLANRPWSKIIASRTHQ
jgi:hypothetical protein